jgi:hypothetical protein
MLLANQTKIEKALFSMKRAFSIFYLNSIRSNRIYSPHPQSPQQLEQLPLAHEAACWVADSLEMPTTSMAKVRDLPARG